VGRHDGQLLGIKRKGGLEVLGRILESILLGGIVCRIKPVFSLF